MLAVSSLSNSTAGNTRHNELDLLDTLVSTRSTRRTCPVVSRRDVTSQVQFGLYSILRHRRHWHNTVTQQHRRHRSSIVTRSRTYEKQRMALCSYQGRSQKFAKGGRKSPSGVRGRAPVGVWGEAPISRRYIPNA